MAKDVKEFEYEYNPIKEIKGNAEASKVVWSTKSLETAVEALSKGLPLKSNPFCGTNTKLLKPDLVYKRTKEEVEETIKCIKDIVYFGNKCTLMTPEGLKQVKMRDYQEEYLRHLQHNRFSIYLSCRQSGKSTTTGIYALHKALFRPDTNCLILSKSAAAGKDLLKKIKDMYLYLPYYLKCGTLKWNETSISFDNNSSISTEAFSSTAGLGQTINVLILDEFAWCPPNEVELFYNNIIPTVTTISDSNVCIMSTQNGFNLFYKLWKNAIEKKSIYAAYKTDWYQVPQFNIETKQWEKRTEDWHKMMVGILGSEEAFQYQYGTQFSASDKCLVSREALAQIRNNAMLYTNVESFIYLMNLNNFYIIPGYDVSKFKTNYYTILCDLAEGAGNDSTVFNIFEIDVDEDGKEKFIQCAKWSSDTTDLENAALEFWLMINQMFNSEKIIISIEWNTYGALFYTYLLNYNETDLANDSKKFRFFYGSEIDYTSICHYKKGNVEDNILLSKRFSNTKSIPGIRWNSENKKTACALAKMMIEKSKIIINDLVTVGELENFEDKNDSGTYKASYGHDDCIMTVMQIPMMMQTVKWKNLFEDVKMNKNKQNNYMATGQMNIQNSFAPYDPFSDYYSTLGINNFTNIL